MLQNASFPHATWRILTRSDFVFCQCPIKKAS